MSRGFTPDGWPRSFGPGGAIHASARTSPTEHCPGCRLVAPPPPKEVGHPCRTIRRAFTLVEAVSSIAVVGVLLVAALNAVGSARSGQQLIGEQARGHLLAVDLMTEILPKSFHEPNVSLVSLGPGPSEAVTGNRSLYNDVDDYHGWSASPPQTADGTPLPGLEGWQRSVVVSWVNPANPGEEVLTDTGVKRITVTVSYQRRVVASLVALRTRAWDAFQSPEG